MARPIPPERHSSQSTSTYGFSEVDKFLKNTNNTNFMPNYNLSNGLRYDIEPRRRDISKDQVPSPGTLYDIDQSRAYHGYNEGESPKHRSRQKSGYSNRYYEQKDNNMIEDRYPDESPVSPTSEYFYRHDKSRKSTLKSAVNSIFRIFRNKNANHKDDSQLYMGSKNISNSAHVVHRSGSNRGSGSSNFQRTHSFSAPSRQDRSRSANAREINNTVITREEPRRIVEQQLSPLQQHPRIPPKSEILEAKAKLQPLNRDSSGLPISNPMPIRQPQQQQIVQQVQQIVIQRPTPCQTGIINHGNSCYMNSILQCLACTDKFAQLFVTDNYLKYLKKSSGQKTEKNVSTVLALVLQNMWFNGEIDNAVWKLSQVTAENNSQFGNAYQQDAQEYLIWLLDKIHEELKDENCRNHITSNNRNMNRSEEELAEESLTRLQDGSCSAITKLFCAQFRSSIECVSCKFRNLSFDPFRCVSLTVSPNKNLHLFSAIWIPYNVDRSLTRYGLRMRSNSTIHEMIAFLSSQVRNMSEDFTIPCLLLSSGMCHLLDPRIQIPINTSCPLVLIEVPDGDVKSANTDYIATICTFAAGYGNDSKRHGFPFVVVVHRMWNYTKILEEILHRGNDLINYRIAGLSTHREHCKVVVGDANEGAVLDPGLSFPLLSCNTQNQTSYNDNRMPILQLTIKVSVNYAESFFKNQPELVKDHPSLTSNDLYVTLEDLLHEYVQPEVLDWKCTGCLKNVGRKQLKFHSVPPVLIFHLKRFHLEEDGTMKRVERPVRIPLESLSMSPYICRPDNKTNMLRKKYCKIDSDLSNGDVRGLSNDEYIYDLIGVVHHYGDRINSGHYTATTKNPVDNKWRAFDDVRVTSAEQKDITFSSSAYLLFYERRQTTSAMSARSRPPPHHWFEDVPQHIAERSIRRNLSNGTLNNNNSNHNNSHVSGVKTLPRPTFTSYLPENGPINNTTTVNGRVTNGDRSRSYQNLSGSKYESDAPPRRNVY